MKRLFILLTISFTTLTVWSEVQIGQWQVWEKSFTADTEFNNAYIETLQENQSPYLQVEFIGTEGAAKGSRIMIPGFWDGGKTWRVRFAPPKTGTWGYKTISDDSGLANHQGSISCESWTEQQKRENPTRRGFVQVNQDSPRAGRYFAYSDGNPFLWIGDTWWNWTKRGVPLKRFKILADDRVEKGFTLGQLFFAGRGWGDSSSLLDRGNSKPDLQHIHHIEEMIRYANSKGLTVWVHGWWGGNNIKERFGAEAMRRWWRYMVHRLSAYNVIWVLAGEYNLHNYGGFDLEFWNQLGELIDSEDPYDRIISTHPTPPGWGGGAEAPQWSTADVIHNEKWLDYNQSQVGHGKWRNEMIPNVVKESYDKQPAKPIVVTEPWYEFIKDNPLAKDIRFGAWSAFLSGAAGHSYAGGHVWKAHVPEAPSGKDSWPMEMGFESNTLDYPGAQSLSFMAKFLQKVDWWKLEPQPELIHDNPSHYCAAKLGELYLIYLRWGGTVTVDLSHTPSDKEFTFTWIDLTTEETKSTGTIQGGSPKVLYPPESYPSLPRPKDWLLMIEK